jgi:hypothetical protein
MVEAAKAGKGAAASTSSYSTLPKASGDSTDTGRGGSALTASRTMVRAALTSSNACGEEREPEPADVDIPLMLVLARQQEAAANCAWRQVRHKLSMASSSTSPPLVLSKADITQSMRGEHSITNKPN